MSTVLRESIYDAVNSVNDKLVLDGMDNVLERFVPLLEISSMADAYIVHFFGQTVFHSDENIMIDGMYDTATIEKIIYQNVADVRAVMNHVTASINPACL